MTTRALTHGNGKGGRGVGDRPKVFRDVRDRPKVLPDVANPLGTLGRSPNPSPRPFHACGALSHTMEDIYTLSSKEIAKLTANACRGGPHGVSEKAAFASVRVPPAAFAMQDAWSPVSDPCDPEDVSEYAGSAAPPMMGGGAGFAPAFAAPAIQPPRPALWGGGGGAGGMPVPRPPTVNITLPPITDWSAMETLLATPGARPAIPRAIATYFYQRAPYYYLHDGKVWWSQDNGVWFEGRAAPPPSMWHVIPTVIEADLAAYSASHPPPNPDTAPDEVLIAYDNAFKMLPLLRAVLAAPSLPTQAAKFVLHFYQQSTQALLAANEVGSVQDLMDRNRFFLAFSDGVFDFGDWSFKPLQPEMFIMTTTGYAFPRASNEPVRLAMLDALRTIWEDDFETFRYVLTSLAARLCGETALRWKNVTFLHGNGNNGKGVLFELMAAVFGGYYAAVVPTIFTEPLPPADRPNALLASWKGKRLVVASEPPAGVGLAASTLKALSGGDPLIVRPPYGVPMRFTPQFGIFIQCNAIPPIPDFDDAMGRRLRIVPMRFQFVVVAHPLKPHERTADPAIKARCNSREWRDEMLLFMLTLLQANFEEAVSPAVVAETGAYIESLNPFKAWFTSRYVHDPTLGPDGSTLYYMLRVESLLQVYNLRHRAAPLKLDAFTRALNGLGIAVHTAPWPFPAFSINIGDLVILGFRQL